ncbi:MAG: MMPL family transporter [Flavobacteriales bacterium]|nr:MMPL family transporter [Flavobacteriales bacterium]
MDLSLDRIERLMTRRNAWAVLSILAVLTVVFGMALRNVRLDHDFERFFPTDDPELDHYLAFRERFGHDNDFLLVTATNDGSAFERGFLVAFDSLAGRLERIKDVTEVISITRMSEPHVTPVGVFQVPWLRTASDSTIMADSARIWQDERVRSAFFSVDGRSILLVVNTVHGISKERSDDLMSAVNAVTEGSTLGDIRIAGRIHGQYWYIQKMLRELLLFFSVSVVLLSIFLFIGFRTAWGVVVPIGVVGLSVLWQVGMLTLMGKPLSILTMLLPTILFVVGMSDVVHILERYIEALRLGHGKERALAITYKEVGLATTLTSITTAIGFATLLTSGIQPIREFGVYTGIGVILAFLLAFSLLPAVLLLVRTPVQAKTSELKATWYPMLHALFQWVLRNRRRIPWYFGALAVLCVIAMSNLKVNNYLLEDWPEDDPQKQDYYWFEDQFGGVRGFEMEISVRSADANVWDLDALREMEAVQDWIEREYKVRSILSPVTVVKTLNKAFNGGGAAYYRLPDTQEETFRLVKNTKAVSGRVAMDALVSADGRRARLTGRMRDEGGYIHKQRNTEMDAWISEHDGILEYRQTGMAYLIDRNNEKLSAQLIGGLSIAFLLIGSIMAWVFRDLRMTVISLVPNIFPLLFVAGTMGLFAIDLKVSTAIIFTIAFGIAVDDTIHLFGKLRIELNKGKSLPYAMKRAFLSAGKAVLVTTIMLCSGFVALIASDFASVHNMGFLVSITLAFAVVADLFLLPVLVLLLLPPKKAIPKGSLK